MFKRSFLVLLSLLILGVAGSVMAQSDPTLIGWWRFDEGAGTTATDSSGNGPDIELVDTTWEAGMIGGAVHFQGAGYGSDTSFSFSENAITVCAWVWHDAFMTGVERYVTMGPEAAVLRRNSDGRLHFYVTVGGAFSHIYVSDVLTEGEWLYVAGTWDGDTQRLYLDGAEIASLTPSGVLTGGTMIRLSSPDGEPLNGMLDDARIYSRALSQPEIMKLMDATALTKAAEPVPADEATDVRRDVTLGWAPGEYAATHDVYFGTNFSDVNDAGRSNPMNVLVSEGQAATTYAAAEGLDFETTYYWRVDEVNAAPDNTIYKGDVWSFTAEPFAYPMANIIATSNGVSEGGEGPEKTVDGSGLNADDQHSTSSTDMWLALPGDEPLYIQYEFDRVYKLHQMLVWNYNVQFELLLGFGLKDVTVEYSENGTDWTALGDVPLNQGTAKATYAANTTIDFQGAAAKWVRLTVNSGWSVIGQFGLSEVRFSFIPAHAREPQPANGAADVDVTTTLDWRAGRDAATHEVYFGTDPSALELAGTPSTDSYDPGGLDLGNTYTWQVDETGADNQVWTGSLWSFTTQAFLVVDDFESYDDEDNAIYETWIDGWVNETGSTVGYLSAPFAETTIVNSGGQSMPLSYDNVGVTTAEAELDLGQNWTASGIQSLSLYFYGDPGNSGSQLYIKIDGTKIVYDGSAVNITSATWNLWNIDLAASGASLSNVSSLTIGIEGAGATGIVYIDDIRLYPEILDYHKFPDVTAAGDTVVGVPNDGDWPDAETPDLAIDDDVNTKFLHRQGGAMATGIQVTPAAGATVVTGLTFTTANDVPTRDPITFELSGSNAGIDGPYELIAAGDIVDFAGEAEWPRFTKNSTVIAFDNDVAYAHYQIVFPTLRGESETLMQIAEIELIGETP
jgi:concanavalin A-like lectin/glucanase superfamily protein/F5/8 type C domain-containing protein